MSNRRCLLLFMSMTSLLVVLPFVGEASGARIVANVVHLSILVASVIAVGRSVRSALAATLVAGGVLASHVAGLHWGDASALAWSWAAGAVFYVGTVFCLLRYIFGKEGITADKLYGAAAAYLMLGYMWAYLYAIVQHIYPGSFSYAGSPDATLTIPDLVYFSFTTLTTAGFGDIVPRSPPARALANLEQICGLLFVAVLIARLVSVYRQGGPNAQ